MHALVALAVFAFFASANAQNTTITVYASNEFNQMACYEPKYFSPFVLTDSTPSRFWGNAYSSATYLSANNTISLTCITGSGTNCTRFSSVEVADWPANIPVDGLQEYGCVIMYYSSLYKYSKSCYTEWVCLQMPSTGMLSAMSQDIHADNAKKFAAQQRMAYRD